VVALKTAKKKQSECDARAIKQTTVVIYTTGKLFFFQLHFRLSSSMANIKRHYALSAIALVLLAFCWHPPIGFALGLVFAVFDSHYNALETLFPLRPKSKKKKKKTKLPAATTLDSSSSADDGLAERMPPLSKNATPPPLRQRA
jgi:hypothetical protein